MTVSSAVSSGALLNIGIAFLCILFFFLYFGYVLWKEERDRNEQPDNSNYKIRYKSYGKIKDCDSKDTDVLYQDAGYSCGQSIRRTIDGKYILTVFSQYPREISEREAKEIIYNDFKHAKRTGLELIGYNEYS